MNIKQIAGFHVPGYDNHYEFICADKKWGSLHYYQRDRIKTAVQYLKEYNCAIDIGANVGIFTYNFLQFGFKQIWAFEPDKLNFECLKRNTKLWFRQVHYHNVGLAEGPGVAQIHQTTEGCGHLFLERDDGIQGDISLQALDSYNIPQCNLLKIDVEGFESYVVQGALETIKRCRPVIILEEKNYLLAKDKSEQHFSFRGRPGEIPFYAARRMIEDLEYIIAARITHDFILVPAEFRVYL